MTQGIVASLAAFIIATISAGGYLGIVALMTIESACIPLPSEIIMTFSGYLAFTGRFNLLLAATAGAIGCNVGSAIAYAVGDYGGRPAVLRWGRYVLLSAEELDRVERYFARFGSITVLVARLLPVVRTFIALPAGIARMPQWRFHIYTFVGSWPFCFLLAFIGMKLGQKWDSDPRLRAVMSRLDLVVLAVLVLGFAWFVWNRWRHRRRPTQ